jgi:hypothetical protein
MVCSNPVTNVMSQSSPVHIPTAINAGFSILLFGVFAYMQRNQTRVIRGTLATSSVASAFATNTTSRRPTTAS